MAKKFLSLLVLISLTFMMFAINAWSHPLQDWQGNYDLQGSGATCPKHINVAVYHLAQGEQVYFLADSLHFDFSPFDLSVINTQKMVEKGDEASIATYIHRYYYDIKNNILQVVQESHAPVLGACLEHNKTFKFIFSGKKLELEVKGRTCVYRPRQTSPSLNAEKA